MEMVRNSVVWAYQQEGARLVPSHTGRNSKVQRTKDIRRSEGIIGLAEKTFADLLHVSALLERLLCMAIKFAQYFHASRIGVNRRTYHPGRKGRAL
jgi:hypothetical protein